jgi:hypothetical protein
MSATNPTNVNPDGTPLCDAKTMRGNLRRQKGRFATSDGSLVCGVHAKDDAISLHNKEHNIIYTQLDPTHLISPFTDPPRHALLPNASMPVQAIAKATGADMDQIISISIFALDSSVLRLGSNIFGAATAIQDAFVAEFAARIWDTSASFPNFLTDTGRVIHSPLSGRSIALGMLLPDLGAILHGFTNDLAVLEALGTVLTNGDADSLSSIISHLQGLALPGTGPAGIPVGVPPANQAASQCGRPAP